MPRYDSIQQATFTGRVTRIAFIRGTFIRPAELVVEMENERDVRTIIAYGHTARTLRSFLILGKVYVVDYEPWSGAEFDGELFSARDRNDG